MILNNIRISGVMYGEWTLATLGVYGFIKAGLHYVQVSVPQNTSQICMFHISFVKYI